MLSKSVISRQINTSCPRNRRPRQRPAISQPLNRTPWIAALSLIVVTAILIIAAYRATYGVSEFALTIDPPAPQLPATDSKFAAAFPMAGLTWTGDLDAALKWARLHDCLVLLEFGAQSDTNGELNHANAFQNTAVQMALRRYVRVILYIDTVPERCYVVPPSLDQRYADVAANGKLQTKLVDSAETPFYCVIKPNADARPVVLATFGGLIREPKRFETFLRGPFKEGK
jgi:hypothetical protein